ASVLGDETVGGATVLLPSTLSANDRTTIDAAGALTVDGVVFAVPGAGTPVLAPVAAYNGTALALVTMADNATVDQLRNTDANLGLSRVQFSVPSSDVTWFTGPEATQAWDAAVAIGRWTLSAELLGAARHVIAEAAAYTGQRIQYGKPIGTFQALQHRLASAHSSVTGASHVIDEAAVTGSPWTATVAKTLAGRAAEFACTQAQQCYGAIGFTWEHEFHRSLRRIYQLDRVLDGYRTLEVEIGKQLLAQKSVPKIGAF
ncbi:MAG: acyl-CoA dehydrogenase family protein, partial [Acidimicrobiia bacterium]